MVDQIRSRDTRPLGTTGNLHARSQSAASSNPPPASQRNNDRNQVRGVVTGELAGMLGSVAESMAQSSNPTVQVMGEVLQSLLAGKDVADIGGEIKGIIEDLKKKGVDVSELDNAGKLSRLIDMAKGLQSAIKFFGQAKELISDPNKIKDPQFLSSLMDNGLGMAHGLLGMLELIKNSPIAGRIPGVVGAIGDISALINDFGKLNDGKVEPAEVVSLLSNATSLAANVMTTIAPVTGGTSAVVAAGLKGVSLGLAGLGIVMENWDKVERLASRVGGWFSNTADSVGGWVRGWFDMSRIPTEPPPRWALAGGYA